MSQPSLLHGSSTADGLGNAHCARGCDGSPPNLVGCGGFTCQVPDQAPSQPPQAPQVGVGTRTVSGIAQERQMDVEKTHHSMGVRPTEALSRCRLLRPEPLPRTCPPPPSKRRAMRRRRRRGRVRHVTAIWPTRDMLASHPTQKVCEGFTVVCTQPQWTLTLLLCSFIFSQEASAGEGSGKSPAQESEFET